MSTEGWRRSPQTQSVSIGYATLLAWAAAGVLAGCAVRSGSDAHDLKPEADHRGAYRVLSLEELRARVTVGPSNLNAYHLTGATWVADQPLLVNRDFDFATALGLEGVGVGIAAAKRKSDNDRVAASLSSMARLDLDAELVRALDECGRPCTSALGAGDEPVELAAYVLVYGGAQSGESAVVRTTIEAYRLPKSGDSSTGDMGGGAGEAPDSTGQTGGETLAPTRLIHVSATRALEGAGGWLMDNGAPLLAEARAAVARLVASLTDGLAPGGLAAVSSTPNSTTAGSSTSRRSASAKRTKDEAQCPSREASCPAGDGEAMRGLLVASAEGFDTIFLTDTPKTIVLCERAATVK